MSENYNEKNNNLKIIRIDENIEIGSNKCGYPRLNNINNYIDIYYDNGYIILETKNIIEKIIYENEDQMRNIYIKELRKNYNMILTDPPLILSNYTKIKKMNNIKYPIYAQTYYEGIRILCYKKGLYYNYKLRDYESLNEIKLLLDYFPINSFLDCTFYNKELEKKDIIKVFKNNGYINKKDKNKYILTCIINDVYIPNDDIIYENRIKIIEKCYNMFLKEIKTIKFLIINTPKLCKNENDIEKNTILKKVNGYYYFDKGSDFYHI